MAMPEKNFSFCNKKPPHSIGPVHPAVGGRLKNNAGKFECQHCEGCKFYKRCPSHRHNRRGRAHPKK